MKKLPLALATLLFIASCKRDFTEIEHPSGNPKDNTSITARPGAAIYRGLDLSYSYKIETQLGQSFKNIGGTTKSTFDIAKDYGVNLVRLRLWVNPAANDTESSLAAVKAQALRLKTLGLGFYLDIFYSDYWADPGGQSKPAAWSSLSASALKDTAAAYTTNVLMQLKNQGTTPLIVEVGNEINNGMLWPTYQVSPSSTTNWTNFATFYNALYSAVKGVDASIKIMMHTAGLEYDFFAKANTYGINYDIIGLSWYPGWHGSSFSTLLSGMNYLVGLYNKQIMIAETAYQFGSANADLVANWFDASYLISGYPATQQGQYDFLVQLTDLVQSVNNNNGIGICYWGAEWVAYGGASETNWEQGSRLDNAVLFRSDNYNAIHGIEAFNSSGLNLVDNPGLESGGAATQTPPSWSTWSPSSADADYTEAGGFSGSYKGSHWKATAFEVYTYQTFTGLTNGNYTLKAWVMSGGGQTTNRMEAKDFGGTLKTQTLPVTSAWTEITIANINVSNNQCTIGFYTNSPGNKWSNFDNVLFYKQ